MTLPLFDDLSLRAEVPEWREVPKAHPAVLRLADRHYSRQQPGTSQCTRPGVNLVLILDGGGAVWVTWRPIPQVGRKDRLEAWECTMFRNETPLLSSRLIVAATDVVWRRWGWPPRDGLITSIDTAATRRRRSKRSEPGHCYRAAGWQAFEHSGRNGLVWLRAPHPVTV